IFACVLLLCGWSLLQIVREGRLAQTRWGLLFLMLRSVVAGVLIWMILGPSTVLVKRETHPRSMGVYVDTSSSMQIVDQPDPSAERRWRLAASTDPNPLASIDQAVFFAGAMRQETAHLTELVEQQADRTERQASAETWSKLADKCSKSLAALKGELDQKQTESWQELVDVLAKELQVMLASTEWIVEDDPGDREERLIRLGELGDQFAVRCRILADQLAHGNLDESRSSSHDSEQRIEQLVPALERSLSAWRSTGEEQFGIRLAQFSNKVTPLPIDKWESALAVADAEKDGSPIIRRTDLVELLKQIRDESGKEDLAGAVILTDGRHSVDSKEDPRDLVAQLRIPLYLVPIGRGEMKRDIILHHLHAPRSVVQKDKILIEGIATAYRCAGEGCDVQLLEGGKVIDSKQVAFKNDQEDQRFQFDVPTEQIGRREFVLRIPAIENENSQDNNFSKVGVDVTDAVLTILVSDGRARWEYQYLVNLFRRQDRVEFDQLKFSPRPQGTGKREQTHEFPRTVEEWSQYRVVILGDVSPRQLNQESQEALRRYIVERGGCLVVIAGHHDMPQAFAGEPLEELLPVETSQGFAPSREGYRIEMTTEGKTADVMQLSDDLATTEGIWREMSASLPIYFLSTYHKPKPTSQVLLRALPVNGGEASEESAAFLSWQQVGAGRVAYLSSPATYQLRLRNGDKFHHRFWGQLVRWISSGGTLSGSKCVKLMADKSHYSQGDEAQITVELSDENGKPVSEGTPILDVIRGGEVQSNVSLAADPKVPGKYLGKFAGESTGQYTFRVRGPDVERLLAEEKYPNPVQIEITYEPGLDRELLDPRSDRPLLEHLAEQTGGMVLEPTALADLSSVINLKPRTVETKQRTPLWDRWWCLWVILGCLSLEWIIRKQVGLA
ncbi:MAG: hypothetical protein KDA36_00495, partial [Planctomycetaceae bacterium]|nr:hypothetical protein [Planctomycetaceae bacterium]